jgi:hypothetical protein
MKSFFAPLLLLAALPLSTSLFKPINSLSTPLVGPGLRVNQVALFQALPYEVKPGGAVTLKGSGFSKQSNAVFIGETSLNATSTTGTTMNVILSKTIPEGVHEVRVVNSLGSSGNTQAKIYLKVTNSPAEAPVILRASVNKGVVTVVGSGFASTNTLVTTLGNVNVSSSDGKTLHFKISDLSLYQKVRSTTKASITFGLAIFVQNEHGLSALPSNLIVTI